MRNSSTPSRARGYAWRRGAGLRASAVLIGVLVSDLSVADDGTPQTSAVGATRIVPGMSVRQAIELIGSEPDKSVEIGAACGMLEVLTWDEGRLRLVTSEGSVSAVRGAKAADPPTAVVE